MSPPLSDPDAATAGSALLSLAFVSMPEAATTGDSGMSPPPLIQTPPPPAAPSSPSPSSPCPFRHEEAVEQGDRVLGHSRIVVGSVENERKKELKNLKKKEIQEKLEKIRLAAGIRDDGASILGQDDIEEDFNPEEYDRKMEAFGDGYYDADDADPGFGSEDGDDLEKEDELLGIPKGWDDFLSDDVLKRLIKKFNHRESVQEKSEKEQVKRKRKCDVSLKEKKPLRINDILAYVKI